MSDIVNEAMDEIKNGASIRAVIIGVVSAIRAEAKSTADTRMRDLMAAFQRGAAWWQENADGDYLDKAAYDYADKNTLAKSTAEPVGWEAFGKEICRIAWEGGDVDGGEIQDLGVKYGVLIEDKYDREKHDCIEFAEEGDTVYFFAAHPAPEPSEAALREAFKAGWRANAVGEANYLDGCEQVDFDTYRKDGIDKWLADLAEADRENTPEPSEREITDAMVEAAIVAYNRTTGYAFPQATRTEQIAGMKAALRAALSTRETCKRCGGKGEIVVGKSYHGYAIIDYCPSCAAPANGLPQNVVNLVIAAREAADTWLLPDCEANALDKALTPFSESVPYENEPAALATREGR